MRTHPHGIRRLHLPDEGPLITELAEKLDMSLSDLGMLNFGVTDLTDIEMHLEAVLKCEEGTSLYSGHSGYLLAKPASLWVLMYDSRGLEITKAPFEEWGAHFGEVYYDPNRVATTVSTTGSRDAHGGTAVANTVTLDFRDGDILLSEHRGDTFIQEVTLSWPTHAGIVGDERTARAIDAMPGHWRRGGQVLDQHDQPTTAHSLRPTVDWLPIRVSNKAFFATETTPGGGLVYRYVGGGGARSQKKESKGLFSRKQKEENAAPPEDPVAAARAAALWARNQIGRNYKFSLKSNIIGTERSKVLKVQQVRKDKMGEALVGDKVFDVSGDAKLRYDDSSEEALGRTETSTTTNKPEFKAFQSHLIFCSELVWRAYRFGAGVTLVRPEDFFYFYDHTNRTVARLLRWADDRQVLEEVISKTRRLPAVAARKIVVEIIRRKHAGYILAPVQLAQSKLVKRVHKIPAKDGLDPETRYPYSQTRVYSYRHRDVHPADVAQALLNDMDSVGQTERIAALNKRVSDAQDKAREAQDKLNEAERKLWAAELNAPSQSQIENARTDLLQLRPLFEQAQRENDWVRAGQIASQIRYAESILSHPDPDKLREEVEKARRQRDAARKMVTHEQTRRNEAMEIERDGYHYHQYRETHALKQVYSVDKPWDDATDEPEGESGGESAAASSPTTTTPSPPAPTTSAASWQRADARRH